MQVRCLLTMRESCIPMSSCACLFLLSGRTKSWPNAWCHGTQSVFSVWLIFWLYFSSFCFFSCACVVCTWASMHILHACGHRCVCSWVCRSTVAASNLPPSLFCLFLEAVAVQANVGAEVQGQRVPVTAELALITLTMFYETQINPSSILKKSNILTYYNNDKLIWCLPSKNEGNLLLSIFFYNVCERRKLCVCSKTLQ